MTIDNVTTWHHLRDELTDQLAGEQVWTGSRIGRQSILEGLRGQTARAGRYTPDAESGRSVSRVAAFASLTGTTASEGDPFHREIGHV